MGRKNLHALEIGCFEGRSTIWLLKHILTSSGSSITRIDPFYKVGCEPRFDHNITISGFSGTVHKIKGRSENVLHTLVNNRYDIISIDGSHRSLNILMDAMFGWQYLNPGES